MAAGNIVFIPIWLTIYVFLCLVYIITARNSGDVWIGLKYMDAEHSPVWSDGTIFTSGTLYHDHSKDCVFMTTDSEWRYDSCWSPKVVICQGKYNAMQCNAMKCNAMQCNAMQCNAISFE